MFTHARGDERPHVAVSIFGIEFIGLLDSGASRSVIGSKGWDVLKNIGLVKLDSSEAKCVTVANGHKCECIGVLRVPIKLREVEKIMDILVVPDLNHSLILGVDFWARMGIVPDLRSGEWKFTSEKEDLDICPVTALNSKDHLTHDQSILLDKLVSDSFEKMGDKLGCTNLVQHRIILKDNVEPIKQRYYPISPALLKHMDLELQDMLDKDVIEPSSSAWSSPIVMVKKKDDSWRFCVDYRKVNRVSQGDAYPLPMVSSILDRLRDAKFMSSLDIKSAYWQIEVEEKSRPITAFTVPGRGLYQFKRLPFGLSTAPATWQRLIDRVIGVDLEPFCFKYLDDIIIITQTFEQHLEVLSKVLQRLIAAGLTLGRDKCHFCRSELRYLGYVVTSQGLYVDPLKVEAILQIPTPTKISDVRSLIGTASWYRRFIPNFSSLTQPLTELLRKNSKFCWTSKQEEAFRQIKEHLISAPVLSCPNFELPFIIQCDASGYGIGAVLTQNHPDIGEKVVCYLSRSLTRQERKFSTTERECLAVLWSIEKLRPYIEGTHFSVITDHWSLCWLNDLKDPMGRLGRWALKLQQYSFDLIHRRGKEHIVPDMLSRSVPVINEMISGNHVSGSKKVDRWYVSMCEKVQKEPFHFPTWKVSGSELYKYVAFKKIPGLDFSSDWKLVVPKYARKEMLFKHHDDPLSGHPGVFKTYKRISEHFYWPKMRSDVAAYVRKCRVCCANKPEQTKPAGLLASHKFVDKAFEVVSCDLIGPLPRSSQGYKFILVIVDHLSKFPLVIPLRNSTSKLVCPAIENHLFLMFGQPRILMCDNGSQLLSQHFRNLLVSYGVKQVFTPNYHPQANITERQNRILETMIRCYVKDNHKDWDKLLPKLACAMRTQVHEVLGYSPYFVVFGREFPVNLESVKLRDDEGFEIDQSVLSKEKFELRSNAFQKLYAEIKERVTKAAERNKKYYDLRHRDVRYEIGDKVYRRNFPQSDATKHFSAKLAPKFVGPFVIFKKVSPWVYKLKDLEGNFRGQWHVKDLKPCNLDPDEVGVT